MGETGRKLSCSRTAPATPVLPRRSRAVRPLLERLPICLPSTRPCCRDAACAALSFASPAPRPSVEDMETPLGCTQDLSIICAAELLSRHPARHLGAHWPIVHIASRKTSGLQQEPVYDGSLKKEKRLRGAFFPLVGLDLPLSLLLLRAWKSKKESVADPEAHSCRPHITCHRGACMAED